MPISASGDMSGSGQDSSGSSGGFPPGEGGATIIVETSGGYSSGYSGNYYPGKQSGFSSGYQSPTSAGITLGQPLAGVTSSGKPTDPDSVTSDIVSGLNGMNQDLNQKFSDYKQGKLSPEKFLDYCDSLDWDLKNIKAALDSLQGLVTDASQTAQGIEEAEKVEQATPTGPDNPNRTLPGRGGPKAAIPVTGKEG